MANGPDVSTPPATPPRVALAGWIVPGGGYFLIGERTRGIVIGVTILALFMLGILIAGVRAVDAPNLLGVGPGSWAPRILQKPWFIGQVLTGPIGIVAAVISHAMGTEYRAATSRLGEIGTLYTAVAGMLNLLAIIDAAHRAANRGKR